MMTLSSDRSGMPESLMPTVRCLLFAAWGVNRVLEKPGISSATANNGGTEHDTHLQSEGEPSLNHERRLCKNIEGPKIPFPGENLYRIPVTVVVS